MGREVAGVKQNPRDESWMLKGTAPALWNSNTDVTACKEGHICSDTHLLLFTV